MNYFAPGLREVSRVCARLIQRGRLVLARRKLARAETDLGLLGWQQADFEGEAQRHVAQLTDFEREQSRLTNDGAAIGQAIRGLREEREAARKEYETARAQIETERTQLAGSLAEKEHAVAARGGARIDADALADALDRELGEVQALYAELLAVEPQTAAIRNEQVRLHERIVAIPNEKADLRVRHQREASEIRALEEAVARGVAELAGADERLRALRAEFDDADGAREREIADRERQKQTLEKKIEGVEKAKESPYGKIGRALADSGVAPMNQPHALDAVLEGRDAVADIERRIAASLKASGREDRGALWVSLWVLAVAAAAALAVLVAAVR